MVQVVGTTRSPGLLLCGLALMLGGFTGQAAQSNDGANGPVVTAVRHWSMGDVTRIVVESTGEFRFKSDRLHNPERLFFDLLGTRPQLDGGRGIRTIAVGDRLVRQIRVAETQRGVTRVVFDLEANVEFSTSQLANPDRLIIELRNSLDARLDARLSLDARLGPTDPIRTPRLDAPSLAERVPRMAQLDLNALQRRRVAALRSVYPVIPDPPAVFDPWLRYEYWVVIRPDPLIAGLAALKPPLRAPPFRQQLRPSISTTPVLARSNPIVMAPPMPPPREPTATPSASPGASPSTPFPTTRAADTPLPAKHSAAGDTMTRILGLKLGRVVIDPGHGGHDGGTSGREGLREKDVVLDVAKRLGALLQERLGTEVVFTRDSDTFIPLTRRTALANERKADLFLSIHVNSSPVASVAGVETYYLNFSTSKSSLDTAMRENAGSDMGVGELQDVLKKIAQKDKADESREFASRVQNSLTGLSPRAQRAARDRGVKRAPFVVLIGASMPSILAEVGFISNVQEETQMGRPEYRQRLAEALYKGVASYANSLSHFQVAQKAETGTPNEPEF